MNLAPQTRHTEINARINAVLARGRIADPNAFDMRVLKRDCEKLREVEPYLGWALLGAYYSVVGNGDESERSYEASLRLVKDPVVYGNYHTSLGNLGFFSKAHQVFVEHGQPETGILSLMSESAQATGSFQTAVARTNSARAKGIESVNPVSQSCEQAAVILARVGITDSDVARHMDAAGVVLRRNKRFCHENVRVDVTDMDGVFVGVTCILKVEDSPMNVFEMNVELAMAEQEMGIVKNPFFDVMFKPV